VNRRAPSAYGSLMPYDPLAPDTLEDPFPAYRALRESCPVHHNPAFSPPFFTLSRYDDVLAGLRDWELWSMRYGDNPQYMSASGLFNDPPEHTAFRKLFNRGFTPRTVGRLDDEIAQIAGDLLDAVADRDRADFHEAYASRLPIIVIARLLGIPTDDLELFREMCDDLTATYNIPDPHASEPARHRLDAYFQGKIDERRQTLADAGIADPTPDALGRVVPDDLLSGFVVAELDGRRLTDAEMHLILLLLLLGGLETSTALLTNLLWRLLEVPARWEAVCADASLFDVAIEESLRYDPPVLGLFRTPTRDVELHGVTIPKKAKTMLCFASANRDDARWDDAGEFRLDRPLAGVRNHLSFGFGAHFCPGAALARLEARVTMQLLTARMPALRLDGPTTRIAPFILWGRGSLPVAW
jgi:cytochrome P450